MRKWLKNWLFREEIEKQKQEVYAVVGSRSGISLDHETVGVQPHVRIGRLNVINGQILEVSTYKRNPNGPDWMTDYYIVDPAQPLSEQIATVMVMKGLEK